MKKYNILEDNIYQLILKIAIPASIGALFSTLYNVVDTIFAGKIGISGEGLAGVSITFPLYLLILAISIGLGTGTTALVGNAIGQGKNSEARNITFNSIILSFAMTLFGILIIYPLLPNILKFMRVENDVLPYALDYIRVIYLGSIFMIISGVINSSISAQGITKPYRNILIIGFFINIILDPLLLGRNPLYYIGNFLFKIIHIISFGSIIPRMTMVEHIYYLPNFGTSGIAMATVIIQFFQMFYMILKLLKSPLFKEKKLNEKLKLDKKILKKILSQGIPSTVNIATVTLGIFILNTFVSYIGGKSATAALGLGYRIEQIAMLPASGVYVAMVSIISQNRGAKNYDRVHEVFVKGFLISTSVLGVGSFLIYIFKFSIIDIFTYDPEIVNIASEYLNIELFVVPAYAFLSCSTSTLQAIKKPKIALYGTLIRQFIMPLILYSTVTFYLELPIRYIWICVFINAWSVGLFMVFYTKKSLEKINISKVEGV